MDFTVENFKIDGVNIAVADRTARDEIIRVEGLVSDVEADVVVLEQRETQVETQLDGLETNVNTLAVTKANKSELETGYTRITNNVVDFNATVRLGYSVIVFPGYQLKTTLTNGEWNLVASLESKYYPKTIIFSTGVTSTGVLLILRLNTNGDVFIRPVGSEVAGNSASIYGSIVGA